MGFLEVVDLHLDLGAFKLNGVSISVDRRDYVCIIGPTGAGKTLLLETIVGLYRPQRGRIELDGRDITYEPPEKRGISIVYQDYALFPHMTVFDNIAYGLRKRVRDRHAVAREVRRVAEMLGIEHLLNRKPETLSGGEKQRVALARALIVEPKLLLLDEPFSALDVDTRRRLRELVKRVVREFETTVLHVTHDLEDVWSLANRVTVMRSGSIVAYGRVDDVLSRPRDAFLARFLGFNVLEGIVVGLQGSGSLVKIGDLAVLSSDLVAPGSRVLVFLKPEHIVVSRRPLSQSQGEVNVFRGCITEMRIAGSVAEIAVDIGGTTLRALMTLNAVRAMDLKPGDTVFVRIDPRDVVLSLEGSPQALDR